MAEETPEPEIPAEITGDEGDPEIEGLLKEFEDAVRPEKGNVQPNGHDTEAKIPAKPNTSTDPQHEALQREHAQLQQRVQDVQDSQDVDLAIQYLNQQLEGLKLNNPVPKSILEKVITSEFTTNQDFANAFIDRYNDPEGWERAMNKLTRDFSTQAEKDFNIDHDTTATQDAIAAAVMAASGKGGVPFEKENQADFERRVKRMDQGQLNEAFPELKKNF